jgi:hypothetical protein
LRKKRSQRYFVTPKRGGSTEDRGPKRELGHTTVSSCICTNANRGISKNQSEVKNPKFLEAKRLLSIFDANGFHFITALKKDVTQHQETRGENAV